MKFVDNIKAAYSDTLEDDRDGGSMVEWVIITAIVAVAAVAVGIWITHALQNKAADTADCIEGSNNYDATKTDNACNNNSHSTNNSYKNDSSYKSRYGN